tara:strand:+ start:2231 stop:2527 length:297 start_codon:yes stop_codon:yes gene_type:complete
MIINRYRIVYPNEQLGGAGVPVRISTGSDYFMLTSYSEMMKINEVLGKDDYKYLMKIKNMIYKFATEHSDFNAKPVINVSPKEFKVLDFIRRKILGYK